MNVDIQAILTGAQNRLEQRGVQKKANFRSWNSIIQNITKKELRARQTIGISYVSEGLCYGLGRL